jgi:hypothetical protein
MDVALISTHVELGTEVGLLAFLAVAQSDVDFVFEETRKSGGEGGGRCGISDSDGGDGDRVVSRDGNSSSDGSGDAEQLCDGQ